MPDVFEHKRIDWKVPVERSLLVNNFIDHASMRLYLILLSYARDKVTAFPARETLAKDMGCSVRNVDLLKRKLKEHNLLDWTTKVIDNKKHNTYQLLQYRPIKGKNEQKIPNKKPVNDFDKVVKNFQKSYRSLCKNLHPDIKETISSGWIKNANYTISKCDTRNLEQYFKENGDAGIKQLEISFKFLEGYLKDRIEYGQFYNTDGSELNPTISLFTKSKIQHDGIMEWAKHNLEVMLEDK
jgi:hypothetical protein